MSRKWISLKYKKSAEKQAVSAQGVPGRGSKKRLDSLNLQSKISSSENMKEEKRHVRARQYQFAGYLYVRDQPLSDPDVR
jgi:hypothetical protein